MWGQASYAFLRWAALLLKGSRRGALISGQEAVEETGGRRGGRAGRQGLDEVWVWSGMGRVGLDWVGIGLVGMGWVGMGWFGMSWVGLGLVGLVWDELGWFGLEWVGLGWVWLGWDGLGSDGFG